MDAILCSLCRCGIKKSTRLSRIPPKEVTLILNDVLQLPESSMATFRERNPAWICLCDHCHEKVNECRSTYERIRELEQKLAKNRRNLVTVIKEALKNEKSRDMKLGNAEKEIRNYVKTREYVIQEQTSGETVDLKKEAKEESSLEQVEPEDDHAQGTPNYRLFSSSSSSDISSIFGSICSDEDEQEDDEKSGHRSPPPAKKPKLEINHRPQEEERAEESISSSIPSPVASVNTPSPVVSVNTPSPVASVNLIQTSSPGKISKPKVTPLSSDQVIELHGWKLSKLERKEIGSYSEIYFAGLDAAKRGDKYDNREGFYIPVLHDHLAYRYEVLEVLGRGGFAQVVRALDHKENVHVAIKIVQNERITNNKVQEEIQILEHIRETDKEDKMNVIRILDHFKFRGHTCIAFELMAMSLHNLIKKNQRRGFSLSLVRDFAYSLLECLNGLERLGIVHCDLKPRNILLIEEGKSGIKVADFGMSFYETKCPTIENPSVCYMAPEVDNRRFGRSVDMWGLGCILVELFTGKVLYQCGYPELRRGPPGSHELQLALKDKKNKIDPLFMDFIEKCLKRNHHVRLTPSAALEHPWMKAALPRASHIENSELMEVMYMDDDDVSITPSPSSIGKVPIHNLKDFLLLFPHQLL